MFADDQRDGLMHYIREHPANNLARLVAADWFEENDQPERAEYIRLAVWLAENPDCARPTGVSFHLGNHASQASLRCGECEPCQARARFAGGVTPWAVEERLGIAGSGYFHAEWSRGFPSRVILCVREWIEPPASRCGISAPRGAAIARLEPVIPHFQDRHPQFQPGRRAWTWAQGDGQDGAGLFFPHLTGKWVFDSHGPRIGYPSPNEAFHDLGRAAVKWALAWNPA